MFCRSWASVVCWNIPLMVLFQNFVWWPCPSFKITDRARLFENWKSLTILFWRTIVKGCCSNCHYFGSFRLLRKVCRHQGVIRRHNSKSRQCNGQRNKGNTKRGVSPRLKCWPSDIDLWPWKSIVFQILLRTKYVPSLVKIHWRMLILECSQGCYGGRTVALLYPFATSLARG